MSKCSHMTCFAFVAVILIAAALMPAMSAEVIFSNTNLQAAAPPPISMITEPLVFTRAGWIYHLPGNGLPSKKICKGEFPAISPDGKRVAFCTSGDKDDAGLVVLSLATLKTVGLLRPGEIALNPRWSPKGNLIAFMLISIDGRRQISVIRPDGAGKRKVCSAEEAGANEIFNLVWAPDGQSIYFHDMSYLFQVDLSGKQISKIALIMITGKAISVTGTDFFVPCPPDSSLIAFTQSVPGTPFFEKVFHEPNTALFIYDIKTKDRKRLTPDDVFAIDPIWSKDGDNIYFSGYRIREGNSSPAFRLYRIGRDGQGLIDFGRGENPNN